MLHKSLKHYSRRAWERIDYDLLPLLGIVVRERKTSQHVGEALAIGEGGQRISVPLERWIQRIPPSRPIYVSPLGMVIQGSRILADYCTITPNLFEARSAFASRLRHMGRIPVLERGTVFGMVCPQTYGDWFGQGLHAICSGNLQSPLIVPRRFCWDREYARRDIGTLGVAVHVVNDTGVVVQRPEFLASPCPYLMWLPGDIEAIRNAMRVVPVAARPGSLLYLSREGEKAASINRKYMSLCIEHLVRELGGRVVRTKDTNFAEYLAMGCDAETVIADHGAAQCNMAWWKTKKVIEIQSTHKNAFFITLGASAGVKQYAVISSLGKTEEQLRVAVGLAIGLTKLSK